MVLSQVEDGLYKNSVRRHLHLAMIKHANLSMQCIQDIYDIVCCASDHPDSVHRREATGP